MNALGSQTALEIAGTGKSGVLIHGVYDLWSPARHYMAYHGTARVLTESASVNIASPIEIPFEKLDRGIGHDAKVRTWNFQNPGRAGRGGWATLLLISSMHSFRSLITLLQIANGIFLNYYQILKNATDQKYGGPYAYVIPAEQVDPASTTRLLDILRRGEIEIRQATSDFDADKRHFAKGSYIIVLGQPVRGICKRRCLKSRSTQASESIQVDLYSALTDVTAQTLPLLLGVNAVAIKNKFDVAASQVDTISSPAGTVDAGKAKVGYILDDKSNSALYALFALLKSNLHAYRLTGGAYSPGTIYLPEQPGLHEAVAGAAGRWPIHFEAVGTAITAARLEIKLPRIGLYQSWVASMDEGWTRWIFDQNGIRLYPSRR